MSRSLEADCLLGCAIGDSVGLPAEGLSRKQVQRRFAGGWRHSLLGAWGMCSDDTEHAFLVGQSLLDAQGDADRFEKVLRKRLRWWFASLPSGMGLATVRSCVKMWLACKKPGVFSAGNGPAMRAALIGVYFRDDPDRIFSFIKASTELTHTDPKAMHAALAVAYCAAALAVPEQGQEQCLARLHAAAGRSEADREWRQLLEHLATALQEKQSVAGFADSLGLEAGVSGYSYHSVPVALFAVLRHLDAPQHGLEALWNCGGDTDSTGAIAASCWAIRHGPSVFPAPWLQGICNGPLSVAVLQRVGQALQQHKSSACSWSWPLVPFRNAFMLVVVLMHGLRRLCPWP